MASGLLLPSGMMGFWQQITSKTLQDPSYYLSFFIEVLDGARDPLSHPCRALHRSGHFYKTANRSMVRSTVSKVLN